MHIIFYISFIHRFYYIDQSALLGDIFLDNLMLFFPPFFAFYTWIFAYFPLHSPHTHLFIRNDVRYREIMARAFRVFYLLKITPCHHDIFYSFKPFRFYFFIKLFIVSDSQITPEYIYLRPFEVSLLLFSCFKSKSILSHI